jgi:beta-mannosidase
MYSDAWGAVGWSIVDYYLDKKPAFYYVRRALTPLLVSFHKEEGREGRDSLALWLTNDTLQSTECLVEYGVLDLVGSTAPGQQIKIVSSPNSARRLTEISLPEAAHAQPGCYLPFARLLVGGRTVSRNRWFPTGFHFKDLDLPQAEIRYAVEQIGDQEFRLQLEARTFAWAVALQVPESVWIEDNYFDLLPGETREITLRGPAADVAKLEVAPTQVPSKG